MRVVVGQDQSIPDLVASIIWGPGVTFMDKKARSIGFLDEAGVLLAGVVFHHHDPVHRTVEISAATMHQGMISPRHLKETLRHAFYGLGARVVIARTREGNRRARRIMSAMGARETVVPEVYGDEGEAVCTVNIKAFRALACRESRCVLFSEAQGLRRHPERVE